MWCQLYWFVTPQSITPWLNVLAKSFYCCKILLLLLGLTQVYFRVLTYIVVKSYCTSEVQHNRNMLWFYCGILMHPCFFIWSLRFGLIEYCWWVSQSFTVMCPCRSVVLLWTVQRPQIQRQQRQLVHCFECKGKILVRSRRDLNSDRRIQSPEC